MASQYIDLPDEGGSGGTVTSVGLSAPSEFTVSGSPVTTSGTLTFTKATQTANTVYAGPTTGAAAAPTFRSLVAADLPTGSVLFNVSTITGTTAATSGNTYLCDTTSSAFTVTLPAHVVNQYVNIKDKKGTFSTNNLTVARNGSTGKIEGLSASYVISSDWNFTGFFDDGTDWYLY